MDAIVITFLVDKTRKELITTGAGSIVICFMFDIVDYGLLNLLSCAYV